VHIVEGPYPVDGTWMCEPYDDRIRVRFIANGELTGLMRLFEPVSVGC
jgi:hypothetical protein